MGTADVAYPPGPDDPPEMENFELPFDTGSQTMGLFGGVAVMGPGAGGSESEKFPQVKTMRFADTQGAGPTIQPAGRELVVSVCMYIFVCVSMCVCVCVCV